MSTLRSVALALQIVAISVAVWGTATTYTKLTQSGSPVFLISTPSNVYGFGKPIVITATLGLPEGGATSLKVCTLGLTTVRVKTVTRNGVSLKPTHGVSDFIADPNLLQDSYIQTIVSGDTVLIPWTIGSDRDGHPILKDVKLNGDY